jgi:hypothetical protein
MGALIYLPDRPESTRSSSPRRAQEAQILFFTGIRYERHDSEEEPAKVARPARRNLGDTLRPRRRRG